MGRRWIWRGRRWRWCWFLVRFPQRLYPVWVLAGAAGKEFSKLRFASYFNETCVEFD